MNAVEIEEAISDLALQPFDAAEFPFVLLAAFGEKDTALNRLRNGNTNASDVPGGVLQRNKIHIGVCEAGTVGETLKALRVSPATTKAKAKFILATDGQTLEAEELAGGETIACAYPDFPNHFGFFLPLAGISTIKEIRDNPIDVRATSRLNKLYVELLNENPDWTKDERRADMNHFMARLVFCFFAEDTDIFNGEGLFTHTIEQMSERDGTNTHEVMETIFRAMNIKSSERANAQPRLPNWANGFPYVNGGLFSGATDVPRFTRMARTYLIHAGNLNWQQINPDIFGSMIQAVADDEERGALGMHYTSVPNILKVLNPLFLDELRAQLAEAGDNKIKLLNLRKRMARIRVFDPACGSGNFLVIAYKQMREIEAEINRRRGELHLRSEIPLTNFRGIELREFPAEIARLALIIAEFQCDVLYRGQKDALAEFLPLDAQNWIVCGNALRLDWLNICPSTGTGVKVLGDDLFNTPLDQSEIDFKNEGGETFICGNPPYVGATVKAPKGASKEMKERLKRESESRKADLKAVFDGRTSTWGTLDYVACWFMKAVDYGHLYRSPLQERHRAAGKTVRALYEDDGGGQGQACFESDKGEESMSDLIIYTSDDGQTRINLRVEADSIWLSQLEIAELFQTTKQNVSLHAKNIFEEGELNPDSVVKDSLTTAADGKNYRTQLYHLDLILAIGYRIRSPRGTQFRQWASRHLKEFLVKGFVMDDERLKNPGAWDYFDELLARIREIRASEKRFYQKVRDLFALSSDYRITEKETLVFFAEVQNKLLFAATGHTAAELIVKRADPESPNMSLTHWSGSRVRKQDVVIAKNYLSEDEIDTLNRLVVIFLEQAELRVKQRVDLTLDFWRNHVDGMLAFNGQAVLQNSGQVRHDDMVNIAHTRYETFDHHRRATEALEADAADLQEIEQLEKRIERHTKIAAAAAKPAKKTTKGKKT